MYSIEAMYDKNYLIHLIKIYVQTISGYLWGQYQPNIIYLIQYLYTRHIS